MGTGVVGVEAQADAHFSLCQLKAVVQTVVQAVVHNVLSTVCLPDPAFNICLTGPSAGLLLLVVVVVFASQ